MALTAAERETVVLMNDADKFIIINTSQRKMVTVLERNAAAEILSDTTFEGTRFLEVKLPLNAFGIRNPKGKRNVEAKRVMKAAKCGADTASGKPCGRIARKDTGKCPVHS